MLIPAEARSSAAPDGSRTDGAASAGGEFRHEGRRRRVAKGKAKRHRGSLRAGNVATKGKVRAKGRGSRKEKIACAAAFEKGKELARDSRFRAAKEWFARCARPGCGSSVRQQCGGLHEEVVAALPSIVPAVNHGAGAPGGETAVKMDGETLTSSVDGSAIIVDPGEHEFTFLRDGEVFATRRLVIEKGQRNRIVSVTFQPQETKKVDLSPTAVVEEKAEELDRADKAQKKVAVEDSEATDEEPPPGRIRRVSPRRASVEADRDTGAPMSAYVWAGVGVLGVGGYGAFTLKGRADNDLLVRECKPDCNPTSVKHIRNLYLAADISLGIGVAALAVSTYLFLRSDDGAEESPRSRTSHVSSLSVEPTASGAVATVGGTF